jgi:hypothetical protein
MSCEDARAAYAPAPGSQDSAGTTPSPGDHGPMPERDFRTLSISDRPSVHRVPTNAPKWTRIQENDETKGLVDHGHLLRRSDLPPSTRPQVPTGLWQKIVVPPHDLDSRDPPPLYALADRLTVTGPRPLISLRRCGRRVGAVACPAPSDFRVQLPHKGGQRHLTRFRERGSRRDTRSRLLLLHRVDRPRWIARRLAGKRSSGRMLA